LLSHIIHNVLILFYCKGTIQIDFTPYFDRQGGK